jgi:hypothetical protein
VPHFATAILALPLAIITLIGPVVSHAGADARDKFYRVGLLWGTVPSQKEDDALEQGRAELGWIVGKDLVIESRSADGHLDRLAGARR